MRAPPNDWRRNYSALRGDGLLAAGRLVIFCEKAHLRPTSSSSKSSCYARPDHTFGSIASVELSWHLGFTPRLRTYRCEARTDAWANFRRYSSAGIGVYNDIASQLHVGNQPREALVHVILMMTVEKNVGPGSSATKSISAV